MYFCRSGSSGFAVARNDDRLSECKRLDQRCRIEANDNPTFGHQREGVAA